jgi:hypothetical protein
MTGMPMSDAVKFWLKKTGQRPATARAAYLQPDGEPRKVEPSPKAQAAGKEIDADETIRLRNELAVNTARLMRASFGTFSERGADHPYLRADHERFVPPLPNGVGTELAGAIFG